MAKKDKVEVFKDAAGGWRWRKVASNGKIVATSGESFRTLWNATRSAKRANAIEVIVNKTPETEAE